MKKLLLKFITIIAISLIPLLSLAADSAPWVNNYALGYGGTPQTEAYCNELADKFDGMTLTSPTCRAFVKARDATTEIYAYTNITNCSSGDPLCTNILAQGSPEDYFLNATADGTIQDFYYESDITPDINTFTRNNGQRICSYFSQGFCAEGGAGTRWQTDYTSSAGRTYLVNFFDTVPQTNTDGYYFDNMGRGGSFGGQLTAGSADGGISVGGYFDKRQPMEENLNSLKQLMIDNISYKYTENTSGYKISNCIASSAGWWNVCVSTCNGETLSDLSVASAGCISKGIFQEFAYKFTDPKGDLQTDPTVLKEIWDAWTSPTDRTYVAWWVANVGATGIEGNSERVKLMALGWFLLQQFDRWFLLYEASTGSYTAPLTNDWFGAMGAPLGAASGAKSAIDSRTDKRLFANGIVVVRFRTASVDDYTGNAQYELGDTYYEVNADGTYGTQVTSKVLRNQEAFIGIKDQSYTGGGVVVPIVTTTEASSITQTTASSGGNVTSAGGGTVSARGVCWNTSPYPTTANSKTIDGSGTGVFTSSITGATADTVYYYRSYSTNEIGTSYGANLQFATLPEGPVAPIVTTTAVTGITNTGATSGGNVTSDGGGTITARGVCWGTSLNPTIADSKTTDGTGTGSYPSSITGLSAQTTIHVRAYATNLVTTSYGSDIEFTTLLTNPSTITIGIGGSIGIGSGGSFKVQ